MPALSPTLPLRGTVRAPDRSDDPNIFPRLNGQAFPEKQPIWNTTKQQSASGRKFKRENWTYPIWHFKVTHNSLNIERGDWERLIAFYNNRRGQGGTFYYWDPTDNFVSNQIIGIGDGVTTEFPLMRAIGPSNAQWTEPVLALVGSPIVQINHLPVTNSTVTGPGVITFNSAPALGTHLSWSGSFMFWCEFTQDSMNTKQLNSLLFSSDGLEFETIKP